jgi:multiple sugar transport system permease protein
MKIFQRYQKKEVLNAYAFLLPIIIVLVAFILIPVIGTIITSFNETAKDVPEFLSIEEFENEILPKFEYDYDKEQFPQLYEKKEDGYYLKEGLGRNQREYINSILNQYEYERKTRFVGFKNYSEILVREDFWRALFFTLMFALTTVVFEIVLGMIFALLLNEAFPGRGLLRAVVLIPWAIPTIISARTWELIYNVNYGILNFLVTNLGLSGGAVNWFGEPMSAFWALVIADVWKTTPFVVIILLAGLQAIPTDIYKQARIDGTGMFKSFWRITLPLIKPVLTIALIFRTIDSMRIFDLVFVLTGGGPGGSTQTLSTLGHQYFVQFNDFPMGSAISVVTFLIAFTLSLLYIKVGKFSESFK